MIIKNTIPMVKLKTDKIVCVYVVAMVIVWVVLKIF